MALKKRTVIDHLSFSVNNFEKSKLFYDQTLVELGYTCIMIFDDENHQVAGYGNNGKPYFWIGKAAQENTQEYVGKSRGFHVAFAAPHTQAISNWYEKCIELGGTDNGKPGPRPEYHPGYYAAFIIDPDGWRIEAVLHTYKA